MNEEDLSPEQRKYFEALLADFEPELARVCVDLRAATPHLHQLAAPAKSDASGNYSSETYTMAFTVDVAGIVETLRQLPDGAGTSAFISAYNTTHPDWRDLPPNEE